MGDFNTALGNSAGPVPFSVGPTTLRLTRLSLGDKADYETWDERRALAACQKGRKDLDPESYALLLRVTRDDIRNKQFAWGGDRWKESIGTDDGQVMLLWLALRTHQPHLTADDARRLRDESVAEDPGDAHRHPEIVAVLFDLAFEGKVKLPPKGTAAAGA